MIENCQYSRTVLMLGFSISFAICGDVFAQSSDPDVIGIRLGMTPDEALPILKKYSVESRKPFQLRFTQLVTKDRNAIAGGKYLSLATADVPHMDTFGDNAANQIAVAFTPSPQNERVAAVYRKLGFPDDRSPLSANVSGDFKAKYGQPTEVRNWDGYENLIWAYDERGRLMRYWKKECLIEFPRTNPNNINPTSMQLFWSNVIVREWKGDTSNYIALCGARQLIARIAPDKIGRASRINVLFWDVLGVMTAQKLTSEFMARAEGEEATDAVSKAKAIRTPSL